MIQAAGSLVRYDNPVLVSRTDASKASKAANEAKGKLQAPAAPGAGKKLPPVEDKGRPKTPTQTEDILNSILPPRYGSLELWARPVLTTMVCYSVNGKTMVSSGSRKCQAHLPLDWTSLIFKWDFLTCSNER